MHGRQAACCGTALGLGVTAKGVSDRRCISGVAAWAAVHAADDGHFRGGPSAGPAAAPLWGGTPSARSLLFILCSRLQ